LLRSAERFNEAAIRLGSFEVKTPPSSVSASLCPVTACDQRRRLAVAVRRDEPGFLRRMPDLRAGPAPRLDAAAFLAMMRTI
jgi:hypothetical protein